MCCSCVFFSTTVPFLFEMLEGFEHKICDGFKCLISWFENFLTSVFVDALVIECPCTAGVKDAPGSTVCDELNS